MKKRKPKTSGLEWLQHSIVAFNGSGYADRESAKAFMSSYIQYNAWKNRYEAVKLANDYYHSVLPLAEHLLPAISETTHKASKKNYQKFVEFRSRY